MHKPKGQGEPLHRNGKTFQRAISVNPIKRDKSVEGTKRCFDSAQHDMRWRGVLKLPTISYQPMMYHSVTQSLHGVSPWKSAQPASSVFYSISQTTINEQPSTKSSAPSAFQFNSRSTNN